jgi:hypothetical protein
MEEANWELQPLSIIAQIGHEMLIREKFSRSKVSRYTVLL